MRTEELTTAEQRQIETALTATLDASFTAARNVSKYYGKSCALAPLDLELEKGKNKWQEFTTKGKFGKAAKKESMFRTPEGVHGRGE